MMYVIGVNGVLICSVCERQGRVGLAAAKGRKSEPEYCLSSAAKMDLEEILHSHKKSYGYRW